MKVSELIRALQGHDGDMEVMIDVVGGPDCTIEDITEEADRVFLIVESA